MTVDCPSCGKNFERIGQHWSMSSSCEYPELTANQKDIITGVLMSDGYIDHGRNEENPRLAVKMITPDYLYYLDKEFPALGTGVKLCLTAEESAKQNRKTGFSTNAKSENYSDVYRWQTRGHPELQEFSDWYSSGEKVWPENIGLTPTVLKHWYCGDGYWNNNSSQNHIKICMANEVENIEKVNKIFKSAGLPTPSNYNIHERKNGSLNCSAYFTIEQSKELWNYMGSPLPGFEYKWPEGFK